MSIRADEIKSRAKIGMGVWVIAGVITGVCVGLMHSTIGAGWIVAIGTIAGIMAAILADTFLKLMVSYLAASGEMGQKSLNTRALQAAVWIAVLASAAVASMFIPWPLLVDDIAAPTAVFQLMSNLLKIIYFGLITELMVHVIPSIQCSEKKGATHRSLGATPEAFRLRKPWNLSRFWQRRTPFKPPNVTCVFVGSKTAWKAMEDKDGAHPPVMLQDRCLKVIDIPDNQLNDLSSLEASLRASVKPSTIYILSASQLATKLEMCIRSIRAIAGEYQLIVLIDRRPSITPQAQTARSLWVLDPKAFAADRRLIYCPYPLTDPSLGMDLPSHVKMQTFLQRIADMVAPEQALEQVPAAAAAAAPAP
ncbi:MAG TPA: hypothetical protein VJB02_07050 [Coxiellaceae bacterium]|nr:hypothetical protein [Coxiellaceae bacterium]